MQACVTYSVTISRVQSRAHKWYHAPRIFTRQEEEEEEEEKNKRKRRAVQAFHSIRTHPCNQ